MQSILELVSLFEKWFTWKNLQKFWVTTTLQGFESLAVEEAFFGGKVTLHNMFHFISEYLLKTIVKMLVFYWLLCDDTSDNMERSTFWFFEKSLRRQCIFRLLIIVIPVAFLDMGCEGFDCAALKFLMPNIAIFNFQKLYKRLE